MNIYILFWSFGSSSPLTHAFLVKRQNYPVPGDRKNSSLWVPTCLSLSSEMARKRKNRTHVKTVAGTSDNTPKSFVIKHGQVGRSLAQLVHDMRKVMEPNTASRLRVSPLSYLWVSGFGSVLTADCK